MAATLLGSLLVSMGLDSGQFKSGLDAAEKQMRASQKRIEAVGQGMVSLGSRLSVAVSAPLTALGVASVKAAMESQDAIAQVNASLASMGNAAGRTSAQLQQLASGQMRKSLYDDDEILRKVTTNLLTFGNIAGDQFDRAQQAAIDLSAKLGQDLQSSTMQLGKALNDPIKGLTALQRIGVSFTADQKKQIETMVAAGETAKAQGVILDEVARQFAGSAEAARNADPFGAMKQSFAEFQETVGAELLKAMPAITGAITGLLQAFNSLSPGVQQAVVVFGALAVVLGPILIVIGGLVSAAAPLIAAFTTIASIVGGFTGVLVAAGAAFKGLAIAMAPVLIPLAAIALAVGAVYLAWKHWDDIKAIAGRVGGAISNWWSGTVSPVLTSAWEKVKMGATVWWQLHVAAVKAMANLYSGVKSWIQDKLRAVFDWLKDKLIAVGKWFYDLYDAVVGHSYIPDMVDEIAAQMKRLDTVMVDQVKGATGKTKALFAKLAEDVRPIMERLFPDSARLNAFNQDFSTIQQAGAAKVIDPTTTQTALDALQNEFYAGLPETTPEIVLQFDDGGSLQSLQDLNAAIAQVGLQAVPTQSRLEDLFGSLGTSSREVFDDLGQQLTDVIMGFQSLGDAIRNVIGRLADKAMNALFNSLFTSIGIPGFAGGTNFAPGGVALVGERGPELVNLPRGSQVVPNHDLSGMMGRSEIHKPTFVFPGVTDARMAREAAGQAARRYKRELNPMRAA